MDTDGHVKELVSFADEVGLLYEDLGLPTWNGKPNVEIAGPTTGSEQEPGRSFSNT